MGVFFILVGVTGLRWGATLARSRGREPAYCRLPLACGSNRFPRWFEPTRSCKTKNTPQKWCFYFGRSDWVRTSDLYVPNVALYQAELHSEN